MKPNGYVTKMVFLKIFRFYTVVLGIMVLTVVGFLTVIIDPSGMAVYNDFQIDSKLAVALIKKLLSK